MDFDSRADELFIDFPEPPTEAPHTVAAVRIGKMLQVGGAIPFAEGKIQHPGRAGVEVRLDAARLAARIAAVQALAAARRELGGSLNKIARVMRVDGFIACGADFQQHEKVLEGASELLTQIFGTAGKHLRTVAGVTSLPRNACVSLSVTFELK